jgi:uncharacterized tellurite resistance protein B-like protein
MLREAWRPAQDLALIYIALAYGTDRDLSDAELDAITDALSTWVTVPDETSIQEIVLEAAAIFLEGDALAEVRRSVRLLRDRLSTEEQRQALEDVVRIAEADGVLLLGEQTLITDLAKAWSLRQWGRELIEATDAAVQEEGETWSLIHELTLLYLVIAHAADDALNDDEIDAILDRVQQWEPDLSEEASRDVVRHALHVYAEQPDEEMLTAAVGALKDALPVPQRLAMLDDFYYVARADGPIDQRERELIQSLARAWDLNVRMNGQHADGRSDDEEGSEDAESEDQ